MSRLQNSHQSFAIGLGIFERAKAHPQCFFKKIDIEGVIVLPVDKATYIFQLN